MKNKKTIIMRRWFVLIILGLLMCGCSKDDNEESGNNNNNNSGTTNDEREIVVMNVSDETDYADVLMICNDGSYLLCDVDNDSGYGTIYMNASVINEMEDGISLYINNEGVPMMGKVKDGTFLFKNFTENTCDFAFINKRGEISYYWDVKFDGGGSKVKTRGVFDIDVSPWVNAWRDLNLKVWTWDEHNLKAFVPFLCKMGSFAITAVGAVSGDPLSITSIGFTFVDEFQKSGGEINSSIWNMVSDYWEGVTLIEDSNVGGWKSLMTNGNLKFSPKNFGLHALANMLNEYGDQQLVNLGKYDGWTAPTFDAKEWQIKLSTYHLDCSSAADTYTVGVTTKTAWEIDASGVDGSWCHVSRSGNSIVVRVDKYEGLETRSGKVVVRTSTYTDDIPPATLSITQTGVMFTLSSPELVFTQKGGEQAVAVTTNDNVKSWEVTSCPSWCKATKKWDNALIVTVKEDKHLTEDREGIITATAQMKGGWSVDRYLTVRQVVEETWDGTRWSFTGGTNVPSYVAQFGVTGVTDLSNFGIEIRDVSRNDFKLSGDLAGGESKSRIYCDDLGRLILSYSDSFSESGVSAKTNMDITFTRTGTDSASGILKANVQVSTKETGTINAGFDGSYKGTLEEMF